MTSPVKNYWCHILITIVDTQKNSDIKKFFICNQYGERLHVINTENIKICLHFLSYLLNICKKMVIAVCIL